MKEEIKNAKSVERLNFLKWVIRDDIQSCCDWIQNVDLDELREIWKQKREELERQK